MKIKGLLRAFRAVRARLQSGLGPEEAIRLKEDVKSLIQTVGEICTRHCMTPDRLPGPSQRVYKFLKEVEVGQLPTGGPKVDGGLPKTTLALRNVLQLGDHLTDRLWRQLPLLTSSPEGRKQLQAEIARHAEAIEGICARQNAAVGALEAPSHQIYC